jgi:hypothetical protein
MTNRPPWFSVDESEDAFDHRMVYADFTAVPEAEFMWFIGILAMRFILKARQSV